MYTAGLIFRVVRNNRPELSSPRSTSGLAWALTGAKSYVLYRECAGAVRPRINVKPGRRHIPDTTPCTKPPYFGRTIAFNGIGISRALRSVRVALAKRTVAPRSDVTAESPALQSSCQRTMGADNCRAAASYKGISQQVCLRGESVRRSGSALERGVRPRSLGTGVALFTWLFLERQCQSGRRSRAIASARYGITATVRSPRIGRAPLMSLRRPVRRNVDTVNSLLAELLRSAIR